MRRKKGGDLVNVKELVFKDDETQEVRLLACGHCGNTFPLQLRESAQRCCDEKCISCGKEMPNRFHFNTCEECREATRIEELKRWLVVSNKDYEHDVYYFQDQFFYDEESLICNILDSCDPDKVPSKVRVLACLPQKVALDSEIIVENLLDTFRCSDHEYPSEDDLVAVKELVNFIEAWNQKQTAVVWNIDRKFVEVEIPGVDDE